MRHSMRRSLGRLVGAVLPVLVFLGSASGAPVSVPLTLVNGWTDQTSFGTNAATIEKVGNIVYFKGGITGGSDPMIATLPVGFRPLKNVFVPVDMCSSNNGRLIIEPTGVVSVESETNISRAICFTSLEGVSFALSSGGFKPLTLINGWTNTPLGTGNAAAKAISNVVHLEGAIATAGSSTAPFILPVGLRPAANVNVNVDMCNATKGRLIIEPSGAVTVQAETLFSNAACLTSLDGVSFVLKDKGFKPLTLVNGWGNAPFGNAGAAAKLVSKIVRFEGAISAAAPLNGQPFVLPTALRPLATVYVPVDMCGATKGRLLINPNGQVLVMSEGPFSNAQCLTSLDGVFFVR